jgi:DNA-binding CsgD family transcriptional regulator
MGAGPPDPIAAARLGDQDSKALARLSPGEREVLRLLARGHDAKSAAIALGISTHAVNERCREARRKLGLTSSRAAARLLAGAEAAGHEFLGDEIFGLGASRFGAAPVGRADGTFRHAALLWMLGGLLMIGIAVAAAWSLMSATGGPAAGAATGAHVVSTTPRQGAVIAPGRFTLSVTFDRPMMADSYSFVQVSSDTYPSCFANRPTVSRDRRTFSMSCTAAAGRQYQVWLNSPPYLNFRAINGVSAEPFQLRFSARQH